MALSSRFQGRQTQFHVELLYGILFIAGFGYLVFRVDPRVAAFEGGLVVGYLLRMWEKMSIYERILEESIAEEAEAQVASEVEEQVTEEVEAEVEEQVADEVATEAAEQVGEEVDQVLEEQVAEEVSTTVDTRIEEAVDTELEEQLPENIDDIDELAEVLQEKDGAHNIDDLIVKEDVEELVTEKVDAALDEEEEQQDAP